MNIIHYIFFQLWDEYSDIWTISKLRDVHIAEKIGYRQDKSVEDKSDIHIH